VAQRVWYDNNQTLMGFAISPNSLLLMRIDALDVHVFEHSAEFSETD